MTSSRKVLEVSELSKRYGDVKALQGISFDVYNGETLVLIGPSGCGKSTTLRLIAGLEKPDSGTVRLNGKVIVDSDADIFTPPEDRNMGMVFQMFAIWPHMTVEDHLAFPLRIRKAKKEEIHRRVREALTLVGLQGLESRLATFLSGGQQQRLVLARALIYRPEILLLDEPLSNLDARLRQQMRIELKELQKQLGITFIFVTHDQTEAMTLADRLVVMHDGLLEQVGTARELYEKPTTRFVESFLGSIVSFQGTYLEDQNGPYVELPGGYRIRLILSPEEQQKHNSPSPVTVSVRPEYIFVESKKSQHEENGFVGNIEEIVYLGDRYELSINACGVKFRLETHLNPELQPGRVSIRVDPHAVKIWPPD